MGLYKDGLFTKVDAGSVKVTCRQCDRVYTIPAKSADVMAWQHGEYIQNAMPYLSVDQRELMISQTCGPCFDLLFPPGD